MDFDDFDDLDDFGKRVKRWMCVAVVLKLLFWAALIAGIAFLVSNCSEIAEGVGNAAGKAAAGFEDAKEKN
jgi:hypothetical protein